MGFSTSNYILRLVVFFLTRCRKKPLIDMGLELDLQGKEPAMQRSGRRAFQIEGSADA